MSNPKEIWSTRLQREIVALSEQGKNDNDIGILPPFISFQNHNLDIDQGTCTANFSITVECAENSLLESKKLDTDIKAKVDSALGQEGQEETNSEKTADETNGVENAGTDGDATEMNITQHASNVSPDKSTFKVQVVVTLDASIQRRDFVANASNSYPFFKPRAFITSGAEHFRFMDIRNGDEIQIDCDWTPSLHLNDAVLDIALKIREGIRRNEPCLKVMRKDFSLQQDLLEEVKADISKAGAKVSSFFSDLRSRASMVADELDHAVGSTANNTPEDVTSSRFKRKVFKSPKVEDTPKVPEKVVTVDNIEIGDEIDLAQDPWKNAVGMYPCKAIRRPDFVTTAMEASKKNESQKVASAGLSGAGTMFRSLTRSAKSLVEETFLMLTEELIIEIKYHRFAATTATVSFAIPVSHLAKLKFRREESISLFFKQAPDDPIVYMCTSSADVVKQIQLVLKKHGVKGKHTNATMQKTVESAIQMIEDIKVMEQQLNENPSKEKLSIIMDLYRQAAERFELAGDVRHQDVMNRMREFLASSIATKILEESDQQLSQEHESEQAKPSGKSDDKNTDEQDDKNDEVEGYAKLRKDMEEAESMLKSAHDGLKDLGVEDIEDDDDDDAAAEQKKPVEVAGDDVISEFEDMLKDADKELQELMGS